LFRAGRARIIKFIKKPEQQVRKRTDSRSLLDYLLLLTSPSLKTQLIPVPLVFEAFHLPPAEAQERTQW
jgi:hypothetical protein